MPAQAAKLSIPTPGARVVVRDAEWIVRRVDHAPGGFQIICDGVSELVRGREAVFLTVLEPAIQVLDPAETGLVPDTSAQFTDSILYMESQLRQAVPSDDRIHVGHTEEIVNAKLNDEVRALDEFKARQLRQLELDLSQSRQSEQFKRHRDEQARQDIQDIHDEYVIWIEETMTTEPHPWIRVICAMTPLAQ